MLFRSGIWEVAGLDDPNQTTQATFVVGMAAAMDSRPWWTKFFYWQFHEGVGDNFGLVDYPDWTPKLAYTQYQALIADHADNANIISNTIPANMIAGRQYFIPRKTPLALIAMTASNSSSG